MYLKRRKKMKLLNNKFKTSKQQEKQDTKTRQIPPLTRNGKDMQKWELD